MKFLSLRFFGLLMILAGTAFAQSDYSIPMDSWVYPVIRQLQTNGFLLELSPGFKPYHRLEVARALIALREKVDARMLSKADLWLAAKLEREFSQEMEFAGRERGNPDTSSSGARIGEEAFLNLVKGDYADFKFSRSVNFRPTSRTEFGFNLGSHFLLYTDATVDQTLRDDTLYTGFRKFGLEALHQQAYILYTSRHVDLSIGRDYLSWGYADDGQVLVSPTAGGFDMVSLSVKGSVLKFNWFVAQLNPMPDSTTVSTPAADIPIANRYFTGSRFEFNISDRIFIGAFQAATFGGTGAPIDLEIINPLRLTYETESNSGKDLNAFLGADVSLFWPRGFNFYGDLLIDDWAVDRKTVSDLSPNKYALDLGARVADPLAGFGLTGSELSLQWRMVRNRVYNEFNWKSYQKLLLRNYPVASPYGDDYWDVSLVLSHWISPEWQISVRGTHLEHGSSNLYGSYDIPWMTDSSVTVQTGYSEPFPYGVIRETNMFGLDLVYQPQNYARYSISATYALVRNDNYEAGLSRSMFSFRLTAYLDFSHFIEF